MSPEDAMLLDRRTHPKTGETCYQFIDWSPAGIETKTLRGVCGSPFRNMHVCVDRVELYRGWCFSSGHMDHYEEEVDEILRRSSRGWPDSLRSAIAGRYGDAVAREVERVLADDDAF